MTKTRRNPLSFVRRDWSFNPWLLLLAGLLVLLGLAYRNLEPDLRGEAWRLDQLDQAITRGNVTEATLLDRDGVLVATLASGQIVSVTVPERATTLTDILERLVASGAEVDVDPQSGDRLVETAATTLLPLGLLAALFAVIVGGGQRKSNSANELKAFSSIGRRKIPVSTTTFADVAGAEELIAEVREVVDYLKDPSRFATMRAVPPRGILLLGPPGCGKTLLARAVAGEAAVPFVPVAGAEFVEALVGVGAARVRDLFRRVRASAPAIVFIDEVDALGRARTSMGGNEERDQTLNQLLVEMDGFDVTSGIVVIAATNRADILDPALLRPGRFDRRVEVQLPDAAQRRAIVALHARGRPFAADVDLNALADRLEGCSGADLAGILNEGALLALRAERTEITNADLEEATARSLVARGGDQTEISLGSDVPSEAARDRGAASRSHVSRPRTSSRERRDPLRPGS